MKRRVGAASPRQRGVGTGAAWRQGGAGAPTQPHGRAVHPNRKTAAELIQRCPEVVEPLRDGRLCVTSIVELAKVLTPENRHEILPRFFHASKREAMAEVAAMRPVETPPRRDVVTAVRPPALALETPRRTSMVRLLRLRTPKRRGLQFNRQDCSMPTRALGPNRAAPPNFH